MLSVCTPLGAKHPEQGLPNVNKVPELGLLTENNSTLP